SATNFAREYARPELAGDAQPQATQVSTKRDGRITGRQQSRVGYRRKYERSAYAYAQERNDIWRTHGADEKQRLPIGRTTMERRHEEHRFERDCHPRCVGGNPSIGARAGG